MKRPSAPAPAWALSAPALLSILKKGEHLLCAKEVFSHTGVFLRELLQEKMGVDVSCADFQDLENVMQNIRANTAILYTETPSNPSLGLVNIRETARVARKTTAS